MIQSSALVQDAPQRPDVRLVIIRLVFEDLGAHVVGRADAGLREIQRPFEDFRNAQITQHESTIPQQKNVLRFEVSM